MKKHKIAKFGQIMANLSAGKLADYEYERQAFADWDLNENDKWIFKNVNIVDVDNGTVYPEKAILIDGKKFGARLSEEKLQALSESPEITKVIDGKGQYLLPGMSDIHCHLSLISEYGMEMPLMYYFDAQRMKNAEFALSQGVTTVRDSGGAYDMVHGLKQEIDSHNLLGPRIIPSYTALTPLGGMWDVNPMMNKMAEMIFGGQSLSYPKNTEEIKQHVDEVISLGAESIKIYLEDKPLYGGTEDTIYNMLSDEQINFVRSLAEENGKIVETHAMFIKGARRAIRGKLNSIAHLTVDEAYSLEEAEMMVQNDVAIVPTFSIGSFLAMDCGSRGYPENPEYQFFREMLQKHVKPSIEKATLPQLGKVYDGFYDFIWSKIENREMPHVGPVYPERLHGFGLHAPKNMENFKKAGTKVGVGTDGGSGIGFSGALGLEFDAFLRYGYSANEIVRMATLGNMEIIKKDDQLGSIAEGKLADMILVEDNPFENVFSMTTPVKVFKEGRCLIDNQA